MPILSSALQIQISQPFRNFDFKFSRCNVKSIIDVIV
jgi:hypothetical protein